MKGFRMKIRSRRKAFGSNIARAECTSVRLFCLRESAAHFRPVKSCSARRYGAWVIEPFFQHRLEREGRLTIIDTMTHALYVMSIHNRYALNEDHYGRNYCTF